MLLLRDGDDGRQRTWITSSPGPDIRPTWRTTSFWRTAAATIRSATAAGVRTSGGLDGAECAVTGHNWGRSWDSAGLWRNYRVQSGCAVGVRADGSGQRAHLGAGGSDGAAGGGVAGMFTCACASSKDVHVGGTRQHQVLRLRSSMRYWWVNQNQTFRHELDGGYLWSPKRNANGAKNPFYETMREVSPGDVVFSFVDTLIAAIGVAQSYCWESPKARRVR